jgi:cellulose synthase/poly-beta-1,6-N-acetylglucosamine synthase-like glycosyltransferase
VQTQAARADYILAKGYPVVMDAYFSVSSRSIAYYRHVWETVGGYLEWLTLAADDTIFWRMIKNRKFRFQLVEKPYVFWLRHKTFKAFGKEAYRYGLGDGESLINFKNFFSTLAETGLRWSLWLHLFIMPFYLSSGILWPLLLVIPQLGGLRSYKNAFKNWQLLKAEGFGLGDLLAAFWLVEVTRYYYINGFLQGWIFSPPFRKEARKKLEPLPV